MRKKSVVFLSILAISYLLIPAQQAISWGTDIVSPEVNDNHVVTFRLQAPKAEEVKISGDWMPAQGWIAGTELMTRGDKGIWTYTTEILEPELYGYSFIIDGLRANDPNNPFVSRDIATLTNIFLID